MYEKSGATRSAPRNGSLPLLIDVLEPPAHPNSPDAAPIRRHRSDYVRWHTTPELHVIYASTWFTLSGCLAIMTYLRFRKGRKPARSFS
jgi:hypothetical protein